MSEISVVIPLYNKEPYIKRAIGSVLAQTFTNFELIVVDDGSTDNSANIARGFTDARVRVITQKNGGECAARNSGIAEAKTELVAFLDADDEYKPHFLETIMRLRKNFPQAGAYGTSYEMILPGGKIEEPKFYDMPQFPYEGVLPNYFKSALYATPMLASACAATKSAFNTAGFFPPGAVMCGDLDTWARVAVLYPVAFSSEVCAVYHRDIPTAVTRIENISAGAHILAALEKLLSRQDLPAETKTYVEEYHNKFNIPIASRYLLIGEKDKARKILKTIKTKVFLKQKLYWLLWSYVPMFIIRLAAKVKRAVFNG